MHILMTNDDGFDAPGITALSKELSSFCRVTVFAPDRERSSCSSSLTLRQFIRVKKKAEVIPGVPIYAADGTTADCCKIALSRVLEEDPPDMIISGMNHGFNAGSDSLYSGTVAGAMESIFSDSQDWQFLYRMPKMKTCFAVPAVLRQRLCGKFLWNISFKEFFQ